MEEIKKKKKTDGRSCTEEKSIFKRYCFSKIIQAPSWIRIDIIENLPLQLRGRISI